MFKYVTFERMPNNIYVKLKNNKLDKILKKLHHKHGTWKDVAKKLNCHEDTLRNTRKRNKISIKLLKRIIRTDIIKENIDKYIIEISKNPFFTTLKIKPSIYFTSEIASLIGYSFGDGCISRRTQFKYANKDKETLEHVSKTIKDVFGNIKFSVNKNQNKVTIYTFPTIISEVLKMYGAVEGNKTNKNFGVPQWIKNGNRQIKTNFLRALFDDEGTVTVTGKTIRIKLCKTKKCKKSFQRFLYDIKNILIELGIDAKINYSKYKNDNTKMEGSVKIYGFENLQNFSKIINFLIKEKRNKLDKTLSSYKRMVSQHNKLTEKIRIDLENGLCNKDMANKYKKHNSTISYHLNKIRANK